MNKVQKVYYDAVFVYETIFQKNIIDYLISLYYRNKNILIINVMNNKIQIDDKIWKINIGGRTNTLKSIFHIWQWRRNTIISTNELIGVHLVGLNCRFFEMFIKYNNLVIIDDGIGTPVLLNHPDRWRKDKSFMRAFVFNYVIFLLLNRKIYKTTNQIIKKVNKYYSIYDLPIIPNILTIKLNFLIDTYKVIRVKKNAVGIIGSGDMNSEEKNSYLRNIFISFDMPIYYFPHPREKNLDLINKDYIHKIIRPQTTIEDFFQENAFPEIIISNESTVLLNLGAMKIKNIKLFYNYRPFFSKYIHYYYEILNYVGIKPL
jgi:hypothetical protein